jgi:hypothetical protein
MSSRPPRIELHIHEYGWNRRVDEPESSTPANARRERESSAAMKMEFSIPVEAVNRGTQERASDRQLPVHLSASRVG